MLNHALALTRALLAIFANRADLILDRDAESGNEVLTAIRNMSIEQRKAPAAPSGRLRLVLPQRPDALVPGEGRARGASRRTEAASSRHA
jgi:hypothetical protein